MNHTYETAVTVLADGRVVPMNPAAIAGALGPQTGPHQEAFAQRTAVCEYKAADLRSVADQLEAINAEPGGAFAGRLDLGRLDALGHSFGCAAALEWCRVDPRCRAAAIWTAPYGPRSTGSALTARPCKCSPPHTEFDVTAEEVVKAGMAPDPEWSEAEKAITCGGWRTCTRHAQPGHTFRIQGATHLNLSFMDVPFLPLGDGAAVKSMLAATTIAPHRMSRITSDLLLAFFRRHLDGVDASMLDRSDDTYPELISGAP